MDKKPKKILVDKDFLELVLKEVKKLKKKIDNPIKEEFTPRISINPNQGDNYLFNCQATALYQVLPEKQLEFNMKVNEFGEELKLLMKKYDFVRSAGEFLAKKIN